MALSNADLTCLIEQTSTQIRLALGKEFARPGAAAFNPKRLINALLEGCDGHQLSADAALKQINQNWRADAYTTSPLLIEVPVDTPSQKQLYNIVRIHLIALCKGFDAAKEKPKQNNSQNTPQQRVYYHGGHQGHHNFWRDIYFINALSRANRVTRWECPSVPTQRPNNGDNNGINIFGCLITTAMLATASVTIGYALLETYKCCNEIYNSEDILGNLSKLGVTAMAAYQGVLIGGLLGAQCFANPLLGAVCGAVILAGFGMALTKFLVASYHALTNRSSALATDPRFCLSHAQKIALFNQGYCPESINEALREIAVLFKNNNATSIMFWSQTNKERSALVSLMRQLKAGFEFQDIVINGKSFHLMRSPMPVAIPIVSSEPQPPRYQPYEPVPQHAYPNAPRHTPPQYEGFVPSYAH